MGDLRVMKPNHGDIRLMWDKDNRDEIAVARTAFDEAMAQRGPRGQRLNTAYRVLRNGEPGDIVTEFDPNAEKLIVAPQMSGGA